MVKKFYLAVTVWLVLLTSVCLGYSDVEEHWAKNSIDSFSKIGVVKGYEDDSFRPDDCMTRAELITVINRLLKNQEESTKFIPDNNSKDWYYSEIRKAVASGIVKGDPDGSIRPDDFITREEAAMLLYRAFMGDSTGNVKINLYDDVEDISEWARDVMSVFVKESYINGYADNTIRPKNNITRAEVVTILDRIFGEIIVKGDYEGNIYGNLLINGPEVLITDMIVEGDLIIAEGSEGKIELKNIIVNGDLIMRVQYQIPKENFTVNGNIIKMYEENTDSEAELYYNSNYGIRFSIPNNASVIEYSDDKKINYRKKNLIVINIVQNEDLHFKTFDTVEVEETERFDNNYEKISEKEFGLAKCGSYYDKKGNMHLIVLKRHDIVYTMYIYNLDNDNIVDNILNSIELIEGEKVHKHEECTYKNRKLYLKFRYLDYIGVDDSYNTGVIYEGDSYFMLFIQINSITDMNEYSIEELKLLFDSLAEEEGEILESDIRKVYQYDAIDYKIQDGEKVSRTLYIVVGNKLYKFIFTGDAEKMESIGNVLFDDLINTIEM